MTGQVPEPGDDGRFEAVLDRLDALVRRGQPVGDTEPPPAPSGPAIPMLTEVMVPDQSGGEDVPVLTEVVQQASGQTLDMIVPAMVEALEGELMRSLKPVLENALRSGIEAIRPQLEETLRQRLAHPPALSERRQIEE